MANSDVHDFLFCDLCGTSLYFDSPIYASCPLCGNQRNVKELQGKVIWCRIDAEDLRKHLNLEPFIKVSKAKQMPEEEEIQQRAVVNEECPKCHHPQLEYYTRQMKDKQCFMNALIAAINLHKTLEAGRRCNFICTFIRCSWKEGRMLHQHL